MAVHDADRRPVVEDGDDDQAPVVEDDAQDG